jgi:hypothetical protein
VSLLLVEDVRGGFGVCGVVCLLVDDVHGGLEVNLLLPDLLLVDDVGGFGGFGFYFGASFGADGVFFHLVDDVRGGFGVVLRLVDGVCSGFGAFGCCGSSAC